MVENIKEKGSEVRIVFRRTSEDQLKIEDKNQQPQLILVNNTSSGEFPPNLSHEATVRVINYVYGTGEDPNQLYAQLVDSPTPVSNKNSNTRTDEALKQPSEQNKRAETNEPNKQDDQNTKQSLSELNGDGSRIDLKVWVASVSDHGSSKVLQTGKLADDSVEYTPPFIIFDSKDARPLEPGKMYSLRNVKDNYYEEQDRIQVVIDDSSDILSFGIPSDVPEAISDTNSDHEKYKNLADAAADHLEAGLTSSESPEDALSDQYRDQ